MGAGRVIRLTCRAKGGAPLLGARYPGERGPFGVWPDLDEQDQDDERREERTDEGVAG